MQIVKTAKRGTYSALITTEHGKRRINTGCTNIDDARKVIEKSGIKEIELVAKSVRITSDMVSQIVAGRRIKLTDAVDMWLEWAVDTNMSKHTISTWKTTVGAWVRDHNLTEAMVATITEKHISAWINSPDSTVKRTTRNARLSCVRSLFNFCSAKGFITGNPANLVRINMNLMSHEQKEKTVRGIFTDADLDRLSTYLKQRITEYTDRIKLMTSPVKGAVEGVEAKIQWLQFWISAVYISRYTGLRMSDVVQLEWASIKPGRLTVWTDKTNARVHIPFAPEEVLSDLGDEIDPDKIEVIRAEYAFANALLTRIFDSIPRDDKKYVFPVQLEEFNRSRSTLCTQFGRLCAYAGLPDLTFHSLRHTYASISKSLGIPIPHISDSMGHSSTATTQVYLHKWPKAPSI